MLIFLKLASNLYWCSWSRFFSWKLLQNSQNISCNKLMWDRKKFLSSKETGFDRFLIPWNPQTSGHWFWLHLDDLFGSSLWLVTQGILCVFLFKLRQISLNEKTKKVDPKQKPILMVFSLCTVQFNSLTWKSAYIWNNWYVSYATSVMFVDNLEMNQSGVET